LLCVTSILTGRGILRLIGIKVEPRVSFCLAPVATLSFWAILLGLGVSIGFTVKDFGLFLWIMTFLLAIVGLWRIDYQIIKQDWFIVLIVCITPFLLMSPYFLKGINSYLGSISLDGWSYIAYGQYLLDYPLGTEGGLSPLAQYAAHLSVTRFIGPAMIGLFTFITGYDAGTQAASGLFLSWTLFVFASSCAFFVTVKKMERVLIPFYVGSCAFCGWLLNLLLVNNYDNALALSFLPSFAGVFGLLDPHDKRWAFIIAGLAIAVLYCYPEMFPFIFGGAFLFFLQRFLVERKNIKAWIIALMCAVVLVMIGIIPLYRDLVKFFINQVGMAMATPGARPGGNAFAELLNFPSLIMAYWGFRIAPTSIGIKLSEVWFFICFLLSLVLYILSIFGIYELFRRKEWGIAVTMIILFAGAMHMIFGLKYSYGAYKLILLNWWTMPFIVIIGTNKLLTSMHTRSSFKRIANGCAVGIFLLFISLNATMLIARYKISPYKNILPFKKLEEVEKIVAPEPIIVSVNDTIANEWAVYFLRDAPIYLTEYRAYMARSHVVPFMQRSIKIDITNARYALTDSMESFPQSNLLWSGGPYYLWKIKKPRWILLTGIKNRNGLEKVGGQPFFWLGKGDTEIRLLSNSNGTAVIHGDFILGPSLPEKPDRHLLVLTDKGYQSYITISKNGPQTISVPIHLGKVRIILRPLDKPSVAVTGNNDPRALLLGVRRLSVRLKNEHRTSNIERPTSNGKR